MEHPWTLWNLLPWKIFHHNLHIWGAMLVAGIILLIGVIAGAHFRNIEKALLPPAKVSTTAVLDWLFSGILKFMEGFIGPTYKRYLTLIGSLALFIFVSNMMGFVPGLLPPTDSINTTLACALVVFVMYNYYGFAENGFSYIKHFLGPVWWLAWFMAPIELISHLARPVSLSFRLFGNIFADHMVLAIFLMLFPFLLPLPVMALGLLVAVVQTAIFVILAMSYIAMAVSHEH
ncbi:MAG: hypothetical protein Kow0090_10240 [Myxococcota bacterium]